MKWIYIILIILCVSCRSTKSINSNCNVNEKRVEIYKDNQLFGIKKNNIIIFFDTGFNSKVQIKINDKVVLDTIINSTPVSTPFAFEYYYIKNKKGQVLKIQTDSECLEVELDTKYRVLGLYNYPNYWMLSYRKRMPQFE